MRRALEAAGVAAALLTALALAGCASQQPQSRASAEKQAACQQQADETFQIRNRGANYAADAYVSGVRDSPFSGPGASGDTSSGLGARYSRDTLYTDCLNGVGPPRSPANVAPAPAHAPGQRPGSAPPPPPPAEEP